MSKPDDWLGLYLHLARASESRGRPLVRDKLLILAGTCAVGMNLPEVACYCRKRILEHNPGHLLRRYPSLQEAMQQEEFLSYRNHLLKAFSLEKAEHMLSLLGIDRAKERQTYGSTLEYAAALLGTDENTMRSLYLQSLADSGDSPGPTNPGADQLSRAPGYSALYDDLKFEDDPLSSTGGPVGFDSDKTHPSPRLSPGTTDSQLADSQLADSQLADSGHPTSPVRDSPLKDSRTSESRKNESPKSVLRPADSKPPDASPRNSRPANQDSIDSDLANSGPPVVRASPSESPATDLPAAGFPPAGLSELSALELSVFEADDAHALTPETDASSNGFDFERSALDSSVIQKSEAEEEPATPPEALRESWSSTVQDELQPPESQPPESQPVKLSQEEIPNVSEGNSAFSRWQSPEVSDFASDEPSCEWPGAEFYVLPTEEQPSVHDTRELPIHLGETLVNSSQQEPSQENLPPKEPLAQEAVADNSWPNQSLPNNDLANIHPANIHPASDYLPKEPVPKEPVPKELVLEKPVPRDSWSELGARPGEPSEPRGDSASPHGFGERKELEGQHSMPLGSPPADEISDSPSDLSRDQSSMSLSLNRSLKTTPDLEPEAAGSVWDLPPRVPTGAQEPAEAEAEQRFAQSREPQESLISSNLWLALVVTAAAFLVFALALMVLNGLT